jgi:O-antigen chain-terminating methyltransferase
MNQPLTQQPLTQQPFYRAFEDRYRGSRATIKARLRAYLPFLQPLAARPRAQALDLGCGRGEWLELLGEQGFLARGVDLDDGMLAACRELGLDVQNGDALAALRAQPDESLALVSAFHLVEHLPFDLVRELVAEALRALAPGGLLVMETPNPENLVVGASDFYTDPSHERPIPPNLLAFATEHAGFARNKIVRLQESPELRAGGRVALGAVLEGASPDYAVVAQKQADAGVLASFDAAFGADYGIDMRRLAHRYEEQRAGDLADVHRIFARFDERIAADRASAAAELRQAELASERALAALGQRVAQQDAAVHEHLAILAARLADSEARLGQGEARMAETEARLAEGEARLSRAEQRADEYAQRIHDLLDSTSWRVTAPLRRVMSVVYRLRAAQREGRLASAAKFRVKRAVRHGGRFVLRQPRMKKAARALLRRVPALESRLYALMLDNTPSAPVVLQAEPGELSPRAARAYRLLQQEQVKQEQARMSNADRH